MGSRIACSGGLPPQWSRSSRCRPRTSWRVRWVRVGAQTGFYVDDVAAQTDADNYVLFQVKAGMSLGKAEHSPLAEALGQAVEQYLNGRLPVGDGTDRQVDPLRDALVLCTDRAAPATVRVNLATALARTGSQPPGTPLDQGLTALQAKALKVVLVNVRRRWETSGHAAMSITLR